MGQEQKKTMILAEKNNFVSHSGYVIHDQYKIINDPVHGSISLHPVAMIIVDSPPFQRLRHIRQVGLLSRYSDFIGCSCLKKSL